MFHVHYNNRGYKHTNLLLYDCLDDVPGGHADLLHRLVEEPLRGGEEYLGEDGRAQSGFALGHLLEDVARDSEPTLRLCVSQILYL